MKNSKKASGFLSKFLSSERGDFSIKGIAIAVGCIVVVGVIVSWLAGGQITEWIADVWDRVWNDWLPNFFS
jgi:hypothetical protein